MFDTWHRRFEGTCSVLALRPPGRAHRLREQLVLDISELAGKAAEALLPELDSDVFLFGHCSGAFVAFELAARLEEAVPGLVRGLFVSGQRGPQVPAREVLHHLDHDEFVRRLLALGGFDPDQVSPESLDLVLPALRADCIAAELYRPSSLKPLPIPIAALGGRQDPIVTRPDILAWRDHTVANFTARFFTGSHFFVRTSIHSVVRHIGTTMGNFSRHSSKRQSHVPIPDTRSSNGGNDSSRRTTSRLDSA